MDFGTNEWNLMYLEREKLKEIIDTRWDTTTVYYVGPPISIERKKTHTQNGLVDLRSATFQSISQ